MGEQLFTIAGGLLIGLLQGVIIMMLKMMMGKIDQICADNAAEHADLWKRINHHSHTQNGKVVVEER